MYENRRKGTKLKGNYAKQRNQTIFSVSRNNSKHFFRIFFSLRNDQNSAKQWPVTYSFVFRETKKTYETVNPSHDTTSTSTSLSAKRMTTSCWLSVIADSELLAFQMITGILVTLRDSVTRFATSIFLRSQIYRLKLFRKLFNFHEDIRFKSKKIACQRCHRLRGHTFFYEHFRENENLRNVFACSFRAQVE